MGVGGSNPLVPTNKSKTYQLRQGSKGRNPSDGVLVVQIWAIMFRALKTFVSSLLRNERDGKEPERAEDDWLGRFRASGDAASYTANRPLTWRCVTVIAREPVPA